MELIHDITYQCPKCKNRINRNIKYINPELFSNPSQARITMSYWCRDCNARHEFTFSLEEIDCSEEYEKNEHITKVRVHTYSFFCNGEQYNKKLRLKNSD